MKGSTEEVVRICQKTSHGSDSLACNPAHDGEVADVDDDAFGGALDGVGGEEGQVLGLQRVFVSELRRSGLRFGLARERRVVHLERQNQTPVTLPLGCSSAVH